MTTYFWHNGRYMQSMQMTSRFRAREKYKHAQYRLVDERCEEMGLGRICVLCRVGVPGGYHLGSEHHEIIPRSELPGPKNWDDLFSLINIALACQAHHQVGQHIRLIWMKAMVTLKLATADQYRRPPYIAYWSDDP